MNDNLLRIRTRRRRSLLAGLTILLLMSFGQLTTDCFNYKRLSITLSGIRHSSYLQKPQFSDEQAINDIEADLKGIQLNLVMHMALGSIVVWCLYDAIRMK
jgi:hypothetical protein